MMRSIRAELSTAIARLAAATLGVLAVVGPPAQASENGLSHYPTGVNTVLNGVLPAPGDLEFYNYSQYYDVGSLKGAHGHDLVPNFGADIKIDAPRFVYTYPVSFGNFHLSSGAIFSVVAESLHIGALHDSHTGFGDTVIEPLFVTWHNNSRTIFAYFGSDDWIPTGDYDVKRLANIGENFWTIGPDAFVTWFPTRDIEVSTALVGEINTTNHATHYHSGDAINIDHSVHWRPFQSVPKLRLALQGYWHQQLQDDTQSGRVVENGFRGRVFAVGPQIEYDVFKRGGILFKFDHEFLVQNRPSGDKYWIELAIPIFGP